jgi:hypothetical protein
MFTFLEILKKDPLSAIIGALTVFCLYLWRQDGKRGVEMSLLGKELDNKKLDKQEHYHYVHNHSEQHREMIDQHRSFHEQQGERCKMAVNLLQDLARR